MQRKTVAQNEFAQNSNKRRTQVNNLRYDMLRLSLALSSLSLLLISSAAFGQSITKLNRSVDETTSREANAIAALKRLDKDVIVYRSRGDFEDDRKLARVSLQTFAQELREVNAELQPLLNEMPAGQLKSQLTNALDSFRDGVFWWRQIDQPRVVSVAALAASGGTRSPADAAFVATMPYTIAIHWRQAHAYLNQSEKLLNEPARGGARQALR